MSKTLFEKIIDREMPADIIYEDEQCLAINDINPQAPVHVLLIPKQCIAKLADAKFEQQAILGHLLIKVPQIVKQLSIQDNFRVVINNGLGAGQTVFHLHFHLLGGRPLGWPPG